MKPVQLAGLSLCAALEASLFPGRAAAHTLDVYPFDVASHAFPSIPKAKLVLGPDGAFYGTASEGGALNQPFGGGFIYRVAATGSGNVIYNFTDQADGDFPQGALAVGPDGHTLYGTSNDGASGGNGVFYSVTTTGTLHVLHTFSSDATVDGAQPNGSLVLGPDGQTFYGTTQSGGTYNNGVVYSVSVSGSLKNLRPFSAMDGDGDNADGAEPTSGLTLGDDGNLYGVAPNGGQNGNGTIFKITTSGSLKTVYSFSAEDTSGENTDGANPAGILAKAPDGTLWGVAANGGKSSFGDIFEITPGGVFKPYYYFEGSASGAFPESVDLGPDGSLWGLTQAGSDAGGSFYGIYPNHTVTNYSFTGGMDGELPSPGLVLGPDGNLYGTTYAAGTYNVGTFFEIVLTTQSIQTYTTAAGRYFGLLNDGSGDVSIKIAPNGLTTAVALADGVRYSYRGQLDSSGAFDETVRGTELSMQLQNVAGVFVFAGNSPELEFTTYRSALDAGEKPVNAGGYTMLLNQETNLGTSPAPAGNGVAVMTVSKPDVVSIAGTLADGSPLRNEGLLLEGTNGYNLYPFFNNYNLTGTVTFNPGSIVKAEGDIQWGENPKKSRYFPLGFNEELTTESVSYVPPPRGGTVLPVTVNPATVTLAGGGLAANLYISVMLTAADKIEVVGTNTYKLRIAINPRNGTFVGSFVAPGARRATSIHGDFYEGTGSAYGSFLGPVSAGTGGIGTVLLQE